MEIVAGGKFVQPQLLLIPVWGAAWFSPSSVALQILLVAFFFMAFGFLNGLLLIALEHQDTLLRIFVVVVPLNIFLSLALIPKYSFVGAAMATAASEIVGFVLSSRAVRRIGVAYPWGSLGRPLLAAGGMVAAFVLVRGAAPNVMILIALGAGTYGLLLLLLSDVETARLFRLLLRRAPRRAA
jgi:O-antigen/teichoic acid export membrane protein